MFTLNKNKTPSILVLIWIDELEETSITPGYNYSCFVAVGVA